MIRRALEETEAVSGESTEWVNHEVERGIVKTGERESASRTDGFRG